jgi:hypothetical protein
MHPRLDAALAEDRVTDIVRAFGVSEGRTWGNYACQRWGRENEVPVGTDLPAAALWHTVVVPPSWFSNGTTPPPNCSTTVNVCVSPPTFVAMNSCPTMTRRWAGPNCH